MRKCLEMQEFFHSALCSHRNFPSTNEPKYHPSLREHIHPLHHGVKTHSAEINIHALRLKELSFKSVQRTGFGGSALDFAQYCVQLFMAFLVSPRQFIVFLIINRLILRS